MAHQVESMMYVGERPWHGLGQYVGDKNVTAKEAIRAAGLDWEVEKLPSFFCQDGIYKPGIGYDIVRTDKNIPLGHVGEVYVPLQNREAFDFMDDVIGTGRAVYHTAGSLCQGKRIWLLVDMKEEDEIVKGDNVRNFILLSNTHDSTQVVNIGLTAVRVVCNNTLQMALDTKAKGQFFGFRHSGQLKNKMASVQDALAAVSSKFSEFVENGKLLAQKRITRQQLDEFLIRLDLERANQREAVSAEKISEFKNTAKYQDLVSAFYRSPGAGLAPETLWSAVNAVTYCVDHTVASRVTDNFQNTAEARLSSAWFNGGSAKKEKALDLALTLAKAA